MKEYVTIVAAAQRLEISRFAVRRLIDSGKLKSRKLRSSKSVRDILTRGELERYITARAHEA